MNKTRLKLETLAVESFATASYTDTVRADNGCICDVAPCICSRAPDCVPSAIV